MIPAKANFIWIGDMPEWVEQNIDNFQKMNPEFEVEVYNESSLSEEYRSIFNSVPDMCQKSDLLRLSVLKRFGGWYFDCDFVFLKPMKEMLEDYKVDDETRFFITKQWGSDNNKVYANGFLGVAKDFDGWNDLDDLIEETADEGCIERTSFGPLLTTKYMNEYHPVNTIVGKWENFYQHRGREVAIAAYREYLAGNASKVIPTTHKVYTIHLWIGGKYDVLKEFVK